MLTQIEKKSNLKYLLENGDFTIQIKNDLDVEFTDKSEFTYVENYFFDVLYNKIDIDTFEDVESIIVAKGSFRIFNAELAMNNEERADYIFDSSSETCAVYTFFYEYFSYDFSEELCKLNKWDYINGFNLGYIDRLEVLPEFRGNEIGKMTINRICDWMQSKVALIAMKSFPLQFEINPSSIIDKKWRSKMNYESFHDLYGNIKNAQKNLNKLYSSFGFKKIKIPKNYLCNDDSYFYKLT